MDRLQTKGARYMKKYKWITIEGEKGIIMANNILDLLKEVNINLMNKNNYYLDDFKSIEEIKLNKIIICEDCRTQDFTMQSEDGEPITNKQNKDAYCFECDAFTDVIEIFSSNN